MCCVLLVDQVQADVAAIAMEEVLPSSVADADALAPEEVYQKKRGREAEFLEGAGGVSLAVLSFEKGPTGGCRLRYVTRRSRWCRRNSGGAVDCLPPRLVPLS